MYKVLMCSDWNTKFNEEENPEFRFFPEENIKKLESKFDVVRNETGRMLTKEELIEKVKDCDAVFTCWGSNNFDAEVVANAPKLKILAHMAGSVTPFVSPELYDKGIQVIGANDNFFAESVAEAALTYMIIALRKIKQTILLLNEKKADGWYRIKEQRGLFDRQVGIVSYGAIAKHLVKLLQPFRCKIKVFSTHQIPEDELKKYNMTQVSLEDIFSTCDVISLHTAWNNHTEKMYNKRLLGMIKDGAVLVNTARGRIIDEEDLIEELKTGRFYAALDVTWDEPCPSNNPLYDMENVLIMPHNGGPTRDRCKHIASSLIDEVYDWLEYGKPLKNVIPKERGLSMTINKPQK